MIDNDTIRFRSREFLEGKWNTCALIMLIFFVLCGGVSSIPRLGFMASILVGGPFVLGLTFVFLRITRGDEVTVEMVFKGFEDYTRSLVSMLLIMVYIILWTLLLIVPGIIAGLSYSMTFFILSENPKVTASEAIGMSKEMMMGHKTELAMLALSFIGWFLLGIITCGIAFLWVGSYYYTSLAIFYQELKVSSID